MCEDLYAYPHRFSTVPSELLRGTPVFPTGHSLFSGPKGGQTIVRCFLELFFVVQEPKKMWDGMGTLHFLPICATLSLGEPRFPAGRCHAAGRRKAIDRLHSKFLRPPPSRAGRFSHYSTFPRRRQEETPLSAPSHPARAPPSRGRCLRRPYLFSRKRKDREEKSAWGRGVQSASEFRREPIFFVGVPLDSHLTGVLVRAA